MLDLIRQHSQSWGVKLLFGLIVLVFVFWGVGTSRDNSTSILATINEQSITIQDFLQEYEKRLETFRQQRPKLSSEEIKSMHFKQQVLDSMINQELLSDLAQTYGVTISDVQLRDTIMHMPVFLNKDKKFDTDRYSSLLRANRMDPAQFEAGYAKDLTIQKLQDYLTLSGTVNEQEAKDFFLFAREQAQIDYILYDQADVTNQVTPTDKEITAYYDAHKDSFAVPAKIRIAYLLLSPETLAATQDISDEVIAAYYAAHPKDFVQEEMVKARHILIKVKKDAAKDVEAKAKKTIDSILAKYKKGTSFEALAKKYSEGPSKVDGGDLGWFGKGRMVPEFETATFALNKGQISKPVLTPFGYHLILVEDRKPEGTKPLEAVKNDIRSKLAKEEAADTLQDSLDQALELVVTGNNLDKAAESLGLDVDTTDFFTQAQGPQEIKMPAEAAATFFTLEDKEITPTPILLEDGYLLAQQLAKQPAHTLPIDKVKGSVIASLKQESAKAIVLEKAKNGLAVLLKNSKDTDKTFTDRIKTSELFGRQGFIPGLGMQPELVEQAFAGTPDAWLSNTYPVTTGVVIARLNNRKLPSTEDWNKEKSYWITSLEQARKQELFMGLMQTLRQQASIQILNQKVLEN